jgi:ligand-binding SRPBCC domain-containing protein
MSREFILERVQFINRPLEEVFAFFSDAQNLSVITPDWLQFKIKTPPPIEMRAGTTIDYQIKLRGIPLRWRSEITAWEPPVRFVDVQRRGPYRYWIHEHAFASVGASRTIVRDRVRYAVVGGRLFHKFFVEPDLERVFNYRTRKLDEIFHGERRAAGGGSPL